ncbi:MAG: DUF4202 family protein [bacterium]
MAHAKNVRSWVVRLRPNAGWALRIAALAHDIERAMPARKVKRHDFADYDLFKKAHARNSARIAAEILNRQPVTAAFKARVAFLIQHHEFGYPQDDELAALRDADAISFFEVNLPFYAQRHSQEETFFRMCWGSKRLSRQARKVVGRFNYEDDRLNVLLKRCLGLKASVTA